MSQIFVQFSFTTRTLEVQCLAANPDSGLSVMLRPSHCQMFCLRLPRAASDCTSKPYGPTLRSVDVLISIYDAPKIGVCRKRACDGDKSCLDHESPMRLPSQDLSHLRVVHSDLLPCGSSLYFCGMESKMVYLLTSASPMRNWVSLHMISR